jgi:hypothetical protein
MGMPQITASTARRSSMRCWSSLEEKSFADTLSASTASVASAMSLLGFAFKALLVWHCLWLDRSTGEQKSQRDEV